MHRSMDHYRVWRALRPLSFLLLATSLVSGCGGMSQLPPKDQGRTGPLTMAEERLSAPGQPAKAPTNPAARGMETTATTAIPGGYPSSPLGIAWTFVSIPGLDSPIPGPPSQPGFVLSKQGGRMVGTTSCNPMSSVYTLDLVGGALKFTLLTNGNAMCPEEQANTENAVVDALIATDGFRMSEGHLALLSKGAVVATLTGSASPPQ